MSEQTLPVPHAGTELSRRPEHLHRDDSINFLAA